MKKIITVFAFALGFMLTAESMAKHANGGFVGPNVSATTVEQALKMSDDTPVVLKGKITQGLGDEKYQFTDGTGTIVVEIDDDEWRGITATPEDTVELRGEIDKDLMRTPEVDVDYVTIVK